MDGDERKEQTDVTTGGGTTLSGGARDSNHPFRTKLSDFPGYFLILLLLHEDERFFLHSGLSWHSIRHAASDYLRSLGRGTTTRIGGGSSITQQLARLQLKEWDRTIKRKLMELNRSRRLEATCSKEEILHEYLEQIPLAVPRSPGIDRAVRFYFSTTIDTLSIEQSLILCYLIPAPTVRSGYFRQGVASERFWFTRSYTKLQELFCILYLIGGERSLREPATVSSGDAIDQMKRLDKTEIAGIAPEVRVRIDVLAAHVLLSLAKLVAQLRFETGASGLSDLQSPRATREG